MSKEKNFYADYAREEFEDQSTFVDSEREFPMEGRCCITGEEVKHSFCRYPDTGRGTMMVMSREAMVRLARKGGSLAEEFDRVITLRRKQEARHS